MITSGPHNDCKAATIYGKPFGTGYKRAFLIQNHGVNISLLSRIGITQCSYFNC